MGTSLSQPVICIVGPTASGKSALAIQVASLIGGEIVSADSMQVYRGMDIGTGKVPVEERAVPHHGLDLVNPGEPFSAALFQEYARQCFDDISARGKTAVMCGGTGFYVRAAIDDYDFAEGAQVGNEVRDRYLRIAEERGPHELWLLLKEADPESAAVIPENDVKRVVRAFEMLSSGESYAARKEGLAHIPQRVPAVMIGLQVDPDILRARISKRVDGMVADGLVDEVQRLLDEGFREGVTSPQAIGYKEIVEAIDGRITLEEAVDQIKAATCRYAKRQRTWFRKDKRIRWIDADDGDLERMTACCMGMINQ